MHHALGMPDQCGYMFMNYYLFYNEFILCLVLFLIHVFECLCMSALYCLLVLAVSRENLSLRFLTRSGTNQAVHVQSQEIEISDLGNRGIVLSM